MDLAILRTDKNKVKDGVWVKDVLPGIDVLMISTSSTEFKKFAQTQMKPYQVLNQEPDIESAEKLGARAFSHCVVKDWKGVVLDGVPTDFSPDVALKIFLEIPDFLAAIVKAASATSNFRSEADKNISGN